VVSGRLYAPAALLTVPIIIWCWVGPQRLFGPLEKKDTILLPLLESNQIPRPSSALATNSFTEVLLYESGRRKEKGGVRHTSACIDHLLISGRRRTGAPGGRIYSVREVAGENICFGLSANPLSPSLYKRFAPGFPLRNFTGQKNIKLTCT